MPGKVSKGARQNSMFGLSLAFLSLLMDGFVGPTQVIDPTKPLQLSHSQAIPN